MNSRLLKSAMDVELDDVEEYNSLITRSKVHSRIPTIQNDMQSTGLFCNNHKNVNERSCTECLLFSLQDSLQNGKLPTTGQVLSYLFTVNQNNFGKDNLVNITSDIMLHWILCNVYTVTQITVMKKLETVMKHSVQRYFCPPFFYLPPPLLKISLPPPPPFSLLKDSTKNN